MSLETLTFDPRGDVVLILKREPEASPVTAGSSTTEGPPSGYQELISTPVNMVVSSKHMSLASSVFASMLKPYFLEGSTLESKGTVEISLPDDEPEMFATLLNIVHGRTKKVPRRLDLGQLTRISILVDKYQMQEAAGAFAEIWIEKFKLEVKTERDQTEALSWLCISWVFEKGDIFEANTEYLIRTSDSEFDLCVMDELPIPEVITRKIQYERREGAIASMLLVLQDLLVNYQETEVACKRTDGKKEACNAMALGSLLRSTQKARLWPFPEPPYQGLTVKGLKDAISAIEFQTLCDILNPANTLACHKGDPFIRYLQPSNNAVSYALKEWINIKIKTLSDKLCGLKIEDFK